jgi:hypothetical protein
MANLEIAEICARSGANCGSLFLDLRFRELVRVSTHQRVCDLFMIHTLLTIDYRLFWPTTPHILIPHLWLILVGVPHKSASVNSQTYSILSAFFQRNR